MIVVDYSGLTAFIAQFQVLAEEFRTGITEEAEMASQDLVENLSRSAPVGAEDHIAPLGDESVHLRDSFSYEHTQEMEYDKFTIDTSKPTTLSYLMEGTGVYGPAASPIAPDTANALWWEGAPHPMNAVLGTPQNDFVTPLLEQFNSDFQLRAVAVILAVIDSMV